jgi:SAM-dependent methyltransferase
VYSERNFARVARALRGEIIEYYRARGKSIDDEAGLVTLDTNSTLVPDRARLLLDLYQSRGERDSIEGLEVADLGCGFGAMSLYFANAGARVTGIDKDQERFRIGAGLAERLGLTASFERGWLEVMALPDSHFDLAVINNSLCYITDRDDRRRALANSLRILKPGGWLIVRDPSRTSPLDPFSRLPLVHQLPPRLARPMLRLTARGRARSQVRLMSPRAGRRALRRAGFGEVHTERGAPGGLRVRYQHLTARRPSETSTEQTARE